MPDRDELIASLKGRIWGGEIHKGGYIHVPQEEAEAILELLKAQEQQEPKPVDVDGKYDWYGLTAECPYCHSKWMPGYPEEVHFCPNCGKAVKWDAAD